MVIMVYFNILTIMNLKLNLNLKSSSFYIYIWGKDFGVGIYPSSFPKLWFLLSPIFSLIPLLTMSTHMILELVVLTLESNRHVRFNTKITSNFAFEVVVHHITTLIDICFFNNLKAKNFTYSSFQTSNYETLTTDLWNSSLMVWNSIGFIGLLSKVGCVGSGEET